ncbi:hypothetical protein SAMN02745181_3525 [Rubritalea squalenifaciens DSM 18772]|uniref:Uncharacterized protein n=1 Tax=Rubritalea squalenifaciens DSM 18772 TaxID=1123071 RepID=A0A1M6R1W3_9BACT|nr:hypothetical protein [Rubritalea squalenifaciens]SHK26432.1 hypothetical protein SAMN02745181_3525 [Rubritalea squalenifaciens DSM 18772]
MMEANAANPYTTPQTSPEIISDGPYSAGSEVITKVSLRSSNGKRCVITGKLLPGSAKTESIHIPIRSGRFNPFAQLVTFNGHIDQKQIEKSRRQKANMIILSILPLGAVFILCYNIEFTIIPTLLLAPYLVGFHYLKRRLFAINRIFAKKEQNDYYRIYKLHPDFVSSLPEHPGSTLPSN